jgi:hypothetical protein
MRETTRKLCKRLLWILPVLLAIYCLAKVTDFAWFHARKPAEFQDANWSGTWRTEQFGGFTGRLIVRLPDPLPEKQDFKTEALVYYPIYSAWKTGRFVKMDFTGHFDPDAPGSAGQSTNTIPSGGGKLKFKGVIGNQVVEYVALINASRSQIVGGYLSQLPNDYGCFVIELD